MQELTQSHKEQVSPFRVDTFSEGVSMYRNEHRVTRSKLSPFRVDTFSEGDRCAGSNTESQGASSLLLE